MEICRICFVECAVYTNLNAYESKLKSYIPEIKIQLVKNPVICTSCLRGLNSSYEFHRQCLNNEWRICNYIKNNNVNGFVDLKLLIGNGPNTNESNLIKMDQEFKESIDQITKDVIEEEIIIKVEDCGNNVESIDSDSVIFYEDNEYLKTNSPKPLFCQMCNMIFQSKNKFILHLKVMHRIEDRRFKCFQCEGSFGTHSQLENHMPVHNGKPEFQCETCTKSFYFKRSLNRHIRRHIQTENTENKFLCTECGKGFPFKNRLIIHFRAHTGERPFQCMVCKKRYSSKAKLDRHKLLHTGEKNHLCDFCEKRFFDRSSLLKHVRIHGGEKKYFCQFCNLGYFQKTPLVLHLRTHTGEKPYACEICGKTFATLTGLKLHSRSHTGEKPFQCEICSKCFSDASGLNRHARSHSEEKTNVCEICQKSYKLKSGLKKHIKSSHDEDKVKKLESV